MYNLYSRRRADKVFPHEIDIQETHTKHRKLDSQAALPHPTRDRAADGLRPQAWPLRASRRNHDPCRLSARPASLGGWGPARGADGVSRRPPARAPRQKTGFPACTQSAVTRCGRCASYAAITPKTPTYLFPSAAGQSVLLASTASSSASARLPRCHSRSTRTCCAMSVGLSSPTMATTRRRCSTTSGTPAHHRRNLPLILINFLLKKSHRGLRWDTIVCCFVLALRAMTSRSPQAVADQHCACSVPLPSTCPNQRLP